MAVRRDYERADCEEGFPLPTVIQSVGIIVVTIISVTIFSAYVAIKTLDTVRTVFA